MGMCKPSGGVIKIYGPYGKNIKDIIGVPNSRVDYYDEVTGELLQQRWFDAEGRAIWDRDWKHGDSNNTHTFPHDHYWNWEVNPDHPTRIKYIGPNGETINDLYY